MIGTKPLPKKYEEKFSTIYHVTTLSKAESIIKTREIYSNDPDRQANFGVIQRHDLARDVDWDVILEFSWKGQHRFGHSYAPGATIDPDQGGPHKNILYHFYAKCPGTNLNENYVQSCLFSGSTGLTLTGIQVRNETSKRERFLLQFRSLLNPSLRKREELIKCLTNKVGTQISIP